MPDPNRPTGADYYAGDDRFASGTEIGGNPLPVDWQTHADKGVRFGLVKARNAQFAGGHGPFFSLNYPLMKAAGLLRAPYTWLDPCEVQLPANLDNVTSANWNALPLRGDRIADALAQANQFCDQILAAGWGAPGDLPPAVDIEQTSLMTVGGDIARLVRLDAVGRPQLELLNGNLLGSIAMAGGVQVVLDGTGAQIGTVQNNAGGHPNGFLPAGGGPVQPARLLREDSDHRIADLWRMLPNELERIKVIVVMVVQIERRLSAAVPGRPARPILYTANTWREHLLSPTDNGGAGYTVVHNGVNFHVDNFADYPYWIAQYPGAPMGVTRLTGFPTTWATVGRTVIWQYTGTPDRNVLVRITAVTAVANPAIRTVDVEELSDFSYLEDLAGITRPQAPKALTRISPAPIDAAPARSFNLLVLGQGFAAGEFPAIAQRLWSDPAHQTSITDTAPFGALAQRSRVACYADDGTGVWLRMRQTPSNVAGLDDALAIPPDAATVLRDYLPLLKIVGDDGVETTADKVWLDQRRSVGATGTLIAILRNGREPARNPPAAPPHQLPAELYQLDPSENYPVPVVAVNVGWNDELWPLVVIRALAQNLGGLRDELELPGAAFDHPAVERQQVPTPNLLFVDAATIAQLAAGVPADFAKQVLADWRLPAGTALDFFASGAAPAALGGVHLVEGGDGFRHQVLRSDFDCLMRRMPVTVAAAVPNAAGQPIRAAGVPFCRVCREWLETVLRGAAQVSAGEGIRLETQRIAYDWVSWKTREEPAAGFTPTTNFNRVHTMAVPAGEPKWSMTIGYNHAAATIGDLFQITNVQLAQRPGDPYARAIDIVHALKFGDITVKYTHRTRPLGALVPVTTVLQVRDALANKLDPPRLTLASDGGTDRAFQLGVRLALSWSITGDWPILHPNRPPAPQTHAVPLFTVDAVLGLVLTGEQDVDPAFPVRGCKLLPQLALRVRRSSGLTTTGRAPAAGIAASVLELQGSVVLEAVNAIAPDPALDPALAAIASGKLGATLVCSSNTAMGDSVMAPVANGVLLPAPGDGVKTQRKVAGMHVNGADPLARYQPFLVGPPAWSWRYDYVRSQLAARTPVVGAYRDTEPKGAANPAAPRDHQFTWPAGSQFRMDVHKFPRQGDYDALYIHPVDAAASPAVALPICGDLGLVLPMRQGASEAVTTLGPAQLGWDAGRLDGGARTSVGAPLVPPNQHVDLVVEKPAAGSVKVTYTATAQAFRPDDWQVFLEQGLALGYRYDIRRASALTWVRAAAALAALPAATLQALNAALADVAHPAALDLQTRAVFRALHAAARLYDAAVDGTAVQQAPEAGDIAGAEAL